MAKQEGPQAAEKKKLQADKKKLRADQKAQKKEAKKKAKELAMQEAQLSEDEETGGFFTLLATIGIVAVWVGIICVIIKLDVGGFGSNILTPLLKDVPVINQILPNSTDSSTTDQESSNGGYTNLSDAVEQIKNLELELAQAQTDAATKDETIVSLKAEVARLKEFENSQVEFQRISTEFFEDVISAENGPGIEEYRKYYEEMNPTTAEYLYKQVVAQLEESKEVQDYASAYSQMKPKQAAAIFEAMSDNLNLAARILGVMSAEDRGAILGVMNSDIAAKLTKLMDPKS